MGPFVFGNNLSNVRCKIMNEAKEFATCVGAALTGHEENLKIFEYFILGAESELSLCHLEMNYRVDQN
jgi:hypothetical protein